MASFGDFRDISYPNKRKGRITPSNKNTTPIIKKTGFNNSFCSFIFIPIPKKITPIIMRIK
jgi:hypothetical protein